MRTLEDLIAYALARAPHEQDKAEDVLQFFCDAVEGDKIPDKALLEYLAECFRLILAGKISPASALNLDGSRGKRRRRTLEKIGERDFDLAYAVVECMDEGEKLRDDAIAAVAAARHASAATVERAYETYHAQARALPRLKKPPTNV